MITGCAVTTVGAVEVFELLEFTGFIMLTIVYELITFIQKTGSCMRKSRRRYTKYLVEIMIVFTLEKLAQE